MEKTIAVLGGDRRMALLARLLAEDGHPVQTWGLAAFGMEDTALEEAAQADRVVLPVPLSRGKNLNCTAAALPLCGLFALLRPEQRLYAGGVKTADREAAAEFGLTLTDYLSREELAVRNGVPTAEGAIEAAMAATDVTLCGTPCLVIGFGRIGKLLAHRLRGLGAEVTVDNSMICARAEDGLHGAEIYLDMPSVGATINIMLAATRAKGNTIIVNAGKEPHIVDLANFINAMGGSVKGAGTDTIRIRGGRSMHGCTYAVIPDQIEAGTLMIAAAATAGDVLIRGALPTHMEALTAKLLEMGARVDEGIGEDSIRVRSDGNHRHVNIKTLPYPGFPTDLQQPMSALLSTARGTSIINETIYEQRHRHLEEIRRMGGQSQIHERIAIIEGVPKLTGCAVTATDLRAGAALVVAGLMAEGVTDIYNVQFIDRGYEHLEKKLSQLGAKIERLPADAD